MKVSCALLQWIAVSSCISASTASLFSLRNSKKNDVGGYHRNRNLEEEDNVGSDIVIKIDGQDVAMPYDSQESYESGQDESMKRPLAISNNGHDVTLSGNIHRAIPFPTPLTIGYSTTLELDFTLTQRLEAHALCIDKDLGIDGSKCFVFAGYQHLGSNWERVHPQTNQGETKHYTIPLHKLASGNSTYNWLVFMEDNDSSNRNSGNSTFSNIEINHGDESPIIIEIDGEEVSIPLSSQQSYDSNEDENMKRPLIVSNNGAEVTLVGNMHRAIPLPTPIRIGYSTTLELDFTLTDEEEAQAICLDDYLGFDARKCFVLAGTQSTHSDWERIEPQATVGETRHYVISLQRLWGESQYNWLIFMQDNDSSNRDTGRSSFSNIKINVGEEYPVMIKIDDSEVAIPLQGQQSYDRGQDEGMRRPVVLTDEGHNITVRGNTHRAIPFPSSLSIGATTTLDLDFTSTDVEEVQALCIEENLQQNGNKCYVFAGTQSLHSYWERLDPQTSVGETRHYSIPLHKLAWGGVDYKWLVFMQDNDSSNRDAGSSSFANIEIKHSPEFFIVQDNVTISTASRSQQRFHGGEDSTSHRLRFPDNGASIQLKGNTWRSLPLGTDVTIDIGTNIDFDFTLTDLRDVHALCFTNDPFIDWNNPRCLVTANTQDWYKFNIYPKAQVGETRHYSIPVGLFYTGTFNHISFILDNDTSCRSCGDSTWSNVKLSQVERPKLSVQVYGATVELDSATQVSADPHQDTITHMLEFPDSTSVTLKGNTAKSLNFTEPIMINHATDIDFDFTLTELTEIHSICIITHTDRRRYHHRYHCFTPANTENWHNDKDLLPKTEVGETRHYHYPVGMYVPEGEALYLVFLQDNDSSDRSTGECTFSNIEFTTRPALKMDILGVETPFFNQQFAYGHHQDTSTNLMQVEQAGNKITLEGNIWKAFAFENPITITEDTILSFTLNVEEYAEIVGICVDEDLVYSDQDAKARCFKLAGDQSSHLGRIIYRGIKETDLTEEKTYHIKLSEYFTGVKNYVAFIHDEDRGDRSGGISHFSNIRFYEKEPSCLSTKSFNFGFSECTTEKFVDMIEAEMAKVSGCNGIDPWGELISLFGVNSDSEVTDKIARICDSAYASKRMAFNEMMGENEKQFVNEFFDGGNIWNYEVDEAGESNLAQDAARIEVVSDTFGSKTNIDFPDVHNFEGCKLRAAMCCYPAKRNGGQRSDPPDNSNACYMDFTKARQSSHVRDGYSIYSGDGNEGALNCHGFAWGNDAGYGDAAFKGNTLFEVAMKKGISENGYVGHLPGAPMCGCVENMPVVTRADCTKTTVSQSVSIKYTPGNQFVAEATVSNINHSNCGDLSTYYETLVGNQKASRREKDLLDKHVVGDCGPALTDFLGTKGFDL